jgi:hypothetical protein
VYSTAQHNRILHEVVQRLSKHNLDITIHRHIQKLHQRQQWFIYNLQVCPWYFTVQNFTFLSATAHELSPQNKMWILNFNRPPWSYFWLFAKVVSLEIVHPLQMSASTILWSLVQISAGDINRGLMRMRKMTLVTVLSWPRIKISSMRRSCVSW